MTKPAAPSAPAPFVDLGAIDPVAACNEGAEIELLHPANATPTGAFISIQGRESDAFKTYIREKANDERRRAALNRNRRDVEPKTVEQMDAEDVELAVVCTTGWRNVGFNGEPLAFSIAAAKKLYEERPWVRNQVIAGVGDLANFMKG